MATDDKAARDEAHRQHLCTEGENVPDAVRDQVLWVAGDVATAHSRGELMEVIQAAYALVGEWEDFLGGDARA